MEKQAPVVNPNPGDRRTTIRLEVVGDLWGTFEAEEAARIVDVGGGGVLLSSPVAIAVDSIQPLLVRAGAHAVLVDVRVRHLRALPATDDEPARYALGVEFVSPPSSLLEFLSAQ